MKLLYVLFFFIPSLLFAQEALPELAEVPSVLLELNGKYDSIILHYMAQYPLLGKIVLILGSLRFIFKPINSLVWYIVNLTPGEEDDLVYSKVRSSKAFAIFAFLLDFTASIKAKNPKE